MVDLRQFWDFQDPVGSREQLEKLLESDDAALVFEVRAQIARTFMLTGEHVAAEAILASLGGEPELRNCPRALAAYQLEQGRLYNDIGQKEQAREYFLNAADSGPLDLRIDALHMLAILAGSEGISLNQQALALALDSDDPWARRWAGSLYNNLGWGFFDLGQLENALEHFRRALEERLNSGTEFQVHVAHWSIARCLREMGNSAEALEILRTLDQSDPYVLEEIAANAG